MSPRPGRISAVVDIDLPRERTTETREMEQYFRLVTTVREALRGEDRAGSPAVRDGEGGRSADERRIDAEGLST
jgi:hypothetical protein